MNWLCWHVGTVTDPKFAVIAKRSGASRALVLGAWAYLLELARQNDGDVSSRDAEAAAALFDVEPEAIDTIFASFVEREMIDTNGEISNWTKRQHGSSTERVKRFRERKRVTETDETLQPFHDVTETRGNGQTDIQTDKQSREARATRLPDDWTPSAELIHWFRGARPDLNLAEVIESFSNHWRAEGGQRSRKVNWGLAFKEWAKRERARPPPKPTAPPRYIQPG